MKKAKITGEAPGDEAGKIADNLGWLAAKIGNAGEAADVLERYLAGVGAGKTGILTLNRIILDMKAANVENIDSVTLENFMKYEGGNPNGKLRRTVGAERNFTVGLALELVSGNESKTETPASTKERTAARYGGDALVFMPQVPKMKDEPAAPLQKSAPPTAQIGVVPSGSGAPAASIAKNFGFTPTHKTAKSESTFMKARKIDTVPTIPAAISETTKTGAGRQPIPPRIAGATNISQNDFYKIVRGDDETALTPMADNEIIKNHTRGVSQRREQLLKTRNGFGKYVSIDQDYAARQRLLANQLDNKDMVRNMGFDWAGEPRPNGKGISMIVFHWTGSDRAQDAYNEFEDFKCKVKDKKTGETVDAVNNGAHYLILPDGKVQELAPPANVVNGAKYYNEIAINVEIVARDEAHITPQQKLAASRLGAYLMEKYSCIKYVAGHCELYNKNLAFVDLLGKNRDAKIKDLKNIGKPDPGEGTMKDIRKGIADISPHLAMVTTRAEQAKMLAYNQQSQSGNTGPRLKQ